MFVDTLDENIKGWIDDLSVDVLTLEEQKSSELLDFDLGLADFDPDHLSAMPAVNRYNLSDIFTLDYGIWQDHVNVRPRAYATFPGNDALDQFIHESIFNQEAN